MLNKLVLVFSLLGAAQAAVKSSSKCPTDMSPLVALLLVFLVSSAPTSLAVDPADSSQGASSGLKRTSAEIVMNISLTLGKIHGNLIGSLQEQDKRAVDSVELQANIQLSTKKDLDELRSWTTAELSALKTMALSVSSLYTRWGSETCSNTASQVYTGKINITTGVIGGGHYNNPGSAVNALCLPLNPVYDGHSPTIALTSLYGMEFETTPEDKHNQDGLCSVCRIPRSTTLMIPATNICPSGWTQEYNGYLMAGRDSHNSGSEFICMDKKQDARHGSNADNNGNLFYYTIGVCGSLPCPPYIEGNVVTCVVCSK